MLQTQIDSREQILGFVEHPKDIRNELQTDFRPMLRVLQRARLVDAPIDDLRQRFGMDERNVRHEMTDPHDDVERWSARRNLLQCRLDGVGRLERQNVGRMAFPDKTRGRHVRLEGLGNQCHQIGVEDERLVVPRAVVRID